MIIIVDSALEERIEQFANHLTAKWDDKGVTFLDTSKRDNNCFYAENPL